MSSLSGVGAGEVLEFWFVGDIKELYATKWFPDAGTPKQLAADEAITTRFGALLSEAEAGKLDSWTQHADSHLALIIVLDQFSRHVHRGDTKSIQMNDARTVDLVDEFVNKGWEQGLDVPRTCFLFMPHRHNPTVPRLQSLLKRTDHMTEVHTEHSDLLKKFRRATLRRLQDLEGRVAEREVGHDILELHPFDADESDMNSNILTVTMRSFLETRFTDAMDTLIVSLSGGVDSMVVTKILTHLRGKFLKDSVRIVAAHIDYGNRVESAEEAAFVEEWCAQRNVMFFKRRIDEVKRGITKREEYEEVSRNLRYALYKELTTQFPNSSGVMFGHHQGDVQENVISNVFKGVSALGLAGMSECSNVNGVSIWRPLLSHPKSLIFEFAHKYGVPYFKDTTPKWSNRGRMRNELLPLLQDLFGDGFGHNLSLLATESSELSAIVDSRVFQPTLDTIRHSPVAVWVDCQPFMNQPMLFWKHVFKYICHALLGSSMIRDKSLRQLQERLQRGLPDSFFPLRKGMRTFVENKTVVLFNSDFLPPPQDSRISEISPPTDPGFALGTIVLVGVEQVVGNWKVSVGAVQSETSGKHGERLQLADLLTGTVEYWIRNATEFVIGEGGGKQTWRVAPQVAREIRQVYPFVVGRGKLEEGFVLVKMTYNKDSHHSRE